jgi:mono/diheme cytochrome c family protein
VRNSFGGKRAAAVLAAVAVFAVVAFFFLSRARTPVSEVPAHSPDLANGEVLFHIGGCLSCHEPADDTADAGLPSGGTAFATPAGTFYPQNLTPDPETGIGEWTEVAFVNAMIGGVSPEGRHYFPAFPYTSYRMMSIEDLLDLRAYLMSLPAVRSPNREHDVPMTGLARRAIGLWKLFGLERGAFEPDPDRGATWNRGAYLVNGPGHCGECHTPRNAFMIVDGDRHLAGGPHPAGEEEGVVPGLLDMIDRGRYTDISDLTLALRFGETFGYDKLSSGGMADVQMNLALIPEPDVTAISEYLLTLKTP